MQNFLHLRRHMGTVSKLTLPRTSSTATSSMFSPINRSLCTLRPTRSRDRLATFGAQRIQLFLKVRASSFCRFPLLFMYFQTSMGVSEGNASLWNLSQAHTVGFVSSSRCPPFGPFQELPWVIVDCTWTRLSQTGAHGRAGVRLPVAIL